MRPLAPGSPADDCCGGGCSNRPSFSGGDRKSSKSKNNNVGGSSAAAPAYAGEMDGLSPDGSFDEEAFLSEAGMGSGDDASIAATMRSGNFIERALTSFYRLTRVGWLADKMRGNATLCAVSWFFLLVGGVAHVCRHTGVDTPTSLAVENAATIIVYALAGTSEFVDVSYELAVGNVNIHVLTTLAVLGTIAVGCAMEGALLLVLFASAHFVEQRLTGHARGDLKSLWATVPGEANVVDLNSDGSPNAASERLVPARDVAVGTTVFVKAGQQVRVLFLYLG
jgi:Cd2+/Zn2+-exporting ATPase